MQNVKGSVADDWQSLDCVQLWDLIQRMRAVSVGDVKLAQAIADLDHDDSPETVSMAQISAGHRISSPRTMPFKEVRMEVPSFSDVVERSAIVGAALSLLSRTDKQISRRQLAREAGVTTTKLLKHFRSFPELRAEMVKQGIDLALVKSRLHERLADA